MPVTVQKRSLRLGGFDLYRAEMGMQIMLQSKGSICALTAFRIACFVKPFGHRKMFMTVLFSQFVLRWSLPSQWNGQVKDGEHHGPAVVSEQVPDDSGRDGRVAGLSDAHQASGQHKQPIVLWEWRDHMIWKVEETRYFNQSHFEMYGSFPPRSFEKNTCG